MGGEFQIDFGDATVGLVVTFSFEGRLAAEKLVAEHAETPQIDLLVVQLALDHLRRQVVQRAAQRGASAQQHTQTYICFVFTYVHI